jgi:hypothetical protein
MIVAAPALAHVRARRLLADGVQAVLVDDLLEALVALAARHARAQPLGLALDAQVVRLGLAVVDDERGELELRRARRALRVAAERPRMARHRACDRFGRRRSLLRRNRGILLGHGSPV